jgi:hypothetical protein
MTGYHIDLCPAHSCIRLTVTEETVTPELAEEIYQRLNAIPSRNGLYAAIYDLSIVKGTTITVETVRAYARRQPSIPLGRPHVIVGEQPMVYGLALVRDVPGAIYGHFEIVHTLEEAYKICGVRPEDFTERL